MGSSAYLILEKATGTSDQGLGKRVFLVNILDFTLVLSVTVRSISLEWCIIKSSG